MEMKAIDPKLFVTCRLCLEDMGTYQIVPSVQQQIKYCFDIIVEPFDGLPQLVCKKCESILSDYYVTKKLFNEKQQALKTKLEIKGEISAPPQQETVSSSQSNDNDKPFSYPLEPLPLEPLTQEPLTLEPFALESFKAETHNKRTYLPSLTCNKKSEDLHERSLSTPVNKDNRLLKKRKIPNGWELNYNKYYVCRLCQKFCKTRGSLSNHSKVHEPVLSKYNNIFKKYCKVTLNKIDDKPNKTGEANTVVYSKGKIICDDDRMRYFLVYLSKETAEHETVNQDKCERTNKITSCALDSSDDEIVVSRKSYKKRRLLSTSSNETVVLKGHDKSPLPECKKDEPNVTECINIDDSSDTESFKSTTDLSTANTNKVISKVGDLRGIQNIASVCHNKLLQKRYSDLDVTHSALLNSKILSLGKKLVIKGFSCTGILRYMEYKNLDIKWTSKSTEPNKATNYIYIQARRKLKEECQNNHKGWTFIPENELNTHSKDKSEDNLKSSEPINASTANPVSAYSVPNTSTDIVSSTKTFNEPTNVAQPAVLYTNLSADTDLSLKNKLLNKNPVANPKQLPKKASVADVKPNIKQNDQDNQSMYIDIVEDDISDQNLCMPIITSTTSLAFTPSEKKIENNENLNNDGNAIINNKLSDSNAMNNNKLSDGNAINGSGKSPAAPRIKVKPASELMSERVLNNLSQQTFASNNIWNQTPNNDSRHHDAVNVFTANGVTQFGEAKTACQPREQVPNSNVVVSVHQDPRPPAKSDRGCVILDTVQLPNTKTDSPFEYFKQLLQMHDIILLDTHENLSREFVNLIKFKILYRQDSVAQAVFLCLSLLCSNNKFCLCVKDHNQENNIVLKNLSANWQWEILKIYTGEVVDKLLQNAQKISTEVYEHTKNFLSLLKSIKFITQT